MPSMASLTVKKYDGSTDIVYDSVGAAGGDNSPAVWRQDTGAPTGLPVGLRPQLTMLTKWNGPKTARVANISFVYPYATEDQNTGRYTSSDRVVINNGSMTFPQNVPASVLNEAAYQYANLMATPLVKSALASGYAPS